MDYIGPLINNFRTNSTVFQRFKKVWQSSDGLYYHSLTFYELEQVVETEKMKRFLQSIGMSHDDLENNDYDEVKKCWFWFNQNKQPEQLSDTQINAIDIAAVLNDKLTVGDKVRVRLTYGGSTQFYINGHKDSWRINTVNEVESLEMNTNEIFEIIHSDPWRYIANILETQQDRNTFQFHEYDSGEVSWESNQTPKGVKSRKSTPATTTSIRKIDSIYDESSDIEFFALALVDTTYSCFEPTREDDGAIKVFTIEDNSYIRAEEEQVDPIFNADGNLIIYNKEDIDDFSLIGASSGWSKEYEFTYKGATKDSSLIEIIKTKIKYLQIRDKRENNTMNTLQKQLMNRLYTESVGSDIPRPSNKWGEYFSGNRLIKEKVDNMKRYEFVNLLSDCLDTDFKEEEASTFEKIFAVIIIIVAIVITLYTAGAFATSWAGTAALIQGLGYASLVLTVGGIVLSQMGLSAQSLVKTIGRVAQIVGIAASITGIMAAAQTAWRKAAEAAVLKGTIQSTTEYTVGAFAVDMVSSAIDNVIKSVSGNILNVLKIATDPLGVLMGNAGGIDLKSIGGWFDALETGMAAHNRFMGSSADNINPSTPNEEQLDKTNFQYPDQMYELTEQMIYEPDALQKMSIMKDNQFGLARTEKLLDQIA